MNRLMTDNRYCSKWKVNYSELWVRRCIAGALAGRPLAEISVLFLLAVSVSAWAGSSSSLVLADAERLALSSDPQLGAEQARAQALREDAVAEGQLPDSTLR